MYQSISNETSIKSLDSQGPPYSLTRLHDILFPINHHRSIRRIDLHLSENGHKGIGNKMGQNRRQYKTIGRGVLNKLHPSQGKDGILKEQQQRPGIQILK